MQEDIRLNFKQNWYLCLTKQNKTYSLKLSIWENYNTSRLVH